MAEKKTWEQMSKKEKAVGIIGLAVIAVFVVGVISGVANAIGSTSQTQEQTQPAVEQEAEPVTTHEEVQESETIPFEKVEQEDPLLERGTRIVTTEGKAGTKTLTYKLTLVDGVETKRELVKNEVTAGPVNEVTAVGTKEPYVAPAPLAQSCDPNYSGACVPIASDVDCGGGSGNGPEYVYGVVTVVGSDIYDLDRDGNGLGCE